MKSIILAIFLISGTAFAQTESVSEMPASVLDGVKLNATVTSDYIWRGATQNNKEAALQGGLDYEHDSGLSVGIWGSNVIGGAEVDFYGAFSFAINDDISISPGFTFYHYILGEDVSNFDTFEYNLNFNVYGFGLSVNYGEDYFTSDSSYLYFSLSKQFEIARGLNLGLLFGLNQFDEEDKTGDNYSHYQVSISKALNDFDLGVHYADAIDREYAQGQTTDRSLFFTLGYSL